MKLNYTTGFYNIAFYNININTQEGLNRDVIKKNEATFVHEFIHYLQDLVLPYNIRYNLSNVNITLRRSRLSGVARATLPDRQSHLVINYCIMF